MKSRKDFPELLNQSNLVGQAAEIGVCRGAFSRHILENWRGQKLFMVDPYLYQGRRLDVSDVPQEKHNENYQAAQLIEREFKPRAEIIKLDSVSASARFRDYFFDFIYIDACHDYRSVVKDINSWYPKVRTSGILAGHDFKNSFVRKNLVEVKRAVMDTFYGRETVYQTEEKTLKSWYIIKK